MASLQTLRNRGGVIVAVVIGLALLAFLLGDLLTSSNSLFMDRSVGKVDGNKISAQEYQEKVNYLTDMSAIASGSSSTSPEQAEQIQNQAWESFIRNEGFLPQAEKLGIITVDETIAELFFGKYPSAVLTGMFVNENGVFDTEYLRSFVTEVEKRADPNMSRFMNYLQREVADQNVMSIYKTIVDKGTYITAVEVDFAAELNKNNYNIEYVFNPFSDIADSTVVIPTGDAKKYYESHKNIFKQNVSRTISYVLFEALPSNDDFKLASNTIESMAGDLAASQNPLQYAQANTQGQLDTRYYAIDELSGDKATFAFGGDNKAVFGPVQNGNQFSVSRIADRKVVADSVEISQIVIAAGNKNLADSLADVIVKGANFAELAMQYSLDEQGKSNEGKVGTLDPQTLVGEFSKELIGAKEGEVKVINMQQTTHILKINRVVGEKSRVQLATVNINAEPSNTTRNTTYSRASAFKAIAGKKASQFLAAVKDSNLVSRRVVLNSNMKQVQGIADSREIVKWAFNDGQKEGVSQVMSFGDNIVVAALEEIADDNIMPFEKAKLEILSILTMKKKSDLISQQLKGKSITELAAAGAKVDISTVNFNSYMIGATGFDPGVSGAVCALSNGATSKPIIGMQGVYVAKVAGITENEISKEIEKSRLQAEAEQSSFGLAYQAFIEGLNIEDIRYKFF